VLVGWQPIGRRCSWWPTGAAPASLIPVVAVVFICGLSDVLINEYLLLLLVQTARTPPSFGRNFVNIITDRRHWLAAGKSASLFEIPAFPAAREIMRATVLQSCSRNSAASWLISAHRVRDIAGVNECKVNNGGCDENAVCVNTRRSFYCRCKRGYKGDGFHCTKRPRNDGQSSFGLNALIIYLFASLLFCLLIYSLIYLHIHLFAYILTYLFICLVVYLFTYLVVFLFTYLLTCTLICILILTYLITYQFTYLFVCLFTHLLTN